MPYNWLDYSSDSGVPSTPLLLSDRSIGLFLAVIRSMQFRFTWKPDTDDTDWNDIEHAIAEAIYEISTPMAVDFTPVGTIAVWVGSSTNIPEKWLLCDGSDYNIVDYPELADVLDPRYIDEPGFTVPNMRDRFVKGSGINDDVGDLAGENYHALTVAELPAHHHIVPAHAHTVGTRASAGSTASAVSMAGAVANNSITTDTEPATDTSDTGGNTTFNNQPEYIAVHWIIKALP